MTAFRLPGLGRQRPVLKAITDFWFLFLGQSYEMRTRWFWYLFQMTFVPAVFIIFLWLLVGRGNPGAMLYVITGNLTQSIATSGMLSLGQDIGGMKDHQSFEFFASLPVSKLTFMCAMLARSMTFTLPSAALVLLIGTLCFGLSFHFDPLLVLLIPLGGLSLSGVGALVGFYSSNGRVAGLATQVLNPIIVFLAPVFMAPAALPPVLAKTSLLIPTTYLASSLRDALAGSVGPHTWRAVLVLAGFVAVSLWLAVAKVEWRVRE